MALLIVRTMLGSGAAVGLMTGIGACSSGTLGRSDVESQITAKMTDSAGNKPDTVTCPGDLPAKVGAQLNCEMVVKDRTFNINVTVTSVDRGDVKFDMVETVDRSQVATIISRQLTEKDGHRPDSVTCPDNLKGVTGASLRCELTEGGDRYGVTVTVTSVDGENVDFDIQRDEQPS